MIWEKEIECCNHKTIEEIQLERLKHMVTKAYENVPFYKKKLDEAGVKPEAIQSLRDIQRLPFTTKNDMREQYPFGLFAEPMKNVARIHASSGTTGKPVVAGYTKSDLANWSNAMHVLPRRPGSRTRTLPRLPLAMACSPAVLACITA